MIATIKNYRPLAEVLDGKAIYADLPGTDRAVDVIVPVVIREGRENCGSGAMAIEGGLIRCVLGSGHSAFFRASAGPGSRWWNYGAPHGTHTRAIVKWARISEAEARAETAKR